MLELLVQLLIAVAAADDAVIDMSDPNLGQADS